jgi:hypothetical protein
MSSYAFPLRSTSTSTMGKTQKQGSNKREQQQTVHITFSQALSHGQFRRF